MKEILIRVADKLPKVVSMTGTAVRDNRYRLKFEFDDEWQDGLKTYIIADSRGHFVPYPSEENHIDVELGGSHVINVGVMQDILATSRPCQIFLEESIRQKMKDEIPPPEPDVWTYITEQIRILAAAKLSPVQKAEDMTQEVGVDPDGHLWTSPGSGGIIQETDPTVSDWAKQKTKPRYTASEVGAFSEEAGLELGNYVYQLFLATYAQTTFAEIRSAHRRERHVLLRHPEIGTMPMAACTVEGAEFFTVNEFGTIRIARVNINDDWYVKIVKPEMTENRENTLSNSATNYPSSYAVTQAIAALNTVSSLVFDTIEEMDQYIAEFGDRLKVGQSLYIRASDVPDYWWDGVSALPMESGGSGQPGQDGFSPSASVEQTDDGAVITLTDKDGTTTATITNGKDGQPGEKGDPGNDYVLTDEDKQEIAGMIPGGGSGESDLIVTITENEDGTYTADHTYTEIGAALDAKRQVRVITHLGKVYYYRGSYSSAGAFFEFICYSATNQISFYRIYENGSIVYATQDIVPELRGATANANGWWGYVPQPLTGQQNYILHGDGAWREPAKTISSGSTDAEIPTAKAVYDAIQAAIPDSGDNSGSSAGVVIFSVLYTDEQAVLADAPVVYPAGADMDTLLAAGQAQMVMLTPSDSGDVPAKLGVLLPTSVDVDGQTIVFMGTITGKDGNEAVMAELHTGRGEITVMPMVQNSAGSGSSGGGGVVTITDNGDGTYSSSHTPAEIAAMAQTGAVVAAMAGEPLYTMPLMMCVADAGAVFAATNVDEDDTISTMNIVVTPAEVIAATKRNSIAKMMGASESYSGAGGMVPTPGKGNQDAVLHGDGTWRAALSEEDKMELVTRVLEKLPTWEGGTY